MRIERDLECVTRDGCVLRADRYRPGGEQELPTLLLRTPYDRRRCHYSVYAHPAWYARQGFNVVVQDVRGRFGSDGEFAPFIQEGPDGYDAVEWAARLPRANGAVAMYGQSYSGYAQLAAAVERPPQLAAIAAAVTSADPHGWFYEGGALRLAFAAGWAATLGLHESARRGEADRTAALSAALSGPGSWLRPGSPLTLEPVASAVPWYSEWVTRPGRDDPYWAERDLSSRLASIAVPALLIGGWYDIFLDGTLAAYSALAERDRTVGPTQLLVGPWTHGPWGDVSVDREQVSFIRGCLDTEPNRASPAPVRYRAIFDDTRDSRTSATWPPREAVELTLYLSSDGLANTAGGDGRLGPTAPGDEPPDLYAYDPLAPVRGLGGHAVAHDEQVPLGAHDQRPRQQRPEVLVYTSDPFEQDVVIAGEVEVELFFASTGAGADVAAQLSIVRGGGEVYNVADGIARIESGLAGTAEREQPVRVRVSLRASAFALAAGERIRLDLTGGAFPHFDCDPRTGPQSQLVFHAGDTPSALRLAVLEDASPPNSAQAGL